MIVYLLFALLLSCLQIVNCFECHTFDRSVPHVFNSKTNYNASLDYFHSTRPLNLDFVPKNCKQQKLFLLSRHSTRNPSLNKVNLFKELCPTLQKSLFKEFATNKDRSDCEYRLFYQLYHWTLRYRRKEAALIVPIGDEITAQIGRRYAKTFQNLLFGNYVQMAVSNETRTIQTMDAFTHEFRKALGTKWKVEERQAMHFHHLGRGEDDDPEDELIRKYKESDLVQRVIKSISERLGLKKELKLKEIKSLYQLCAFDYQLYNDTFWCNFFTDRELDILDFLGDASTFRQLHVNAERQLNKSAIFFRELKLFLHRSDEQVFMGFSHSEVLRVVLARLKLFEQGIHLVDDFEEAFNRSADREWRASRTMAFNSNLAFVRYDCPNEVNNQTILRLVTLYQEQPIKLEGCDADRQSQGGLLCPLSTFLRFIYPMHKDLTRREFRKMVNRPMTKKEIKKILKKARPSD